MSIRLHRGQVMRHTAMLCERSVLTTLQAARLDAIVAMIGEDGRFVLLDALRAAEFPGDNARGQEAFQEFRKRVNQAAEQVGVSFTLEVDSRKTTPDQRHGWFTGGDLVNDDITLFTEAAASQTGVEHPVTPSVAELGASRRTRVYVSYAPPTTSGASRKVRTLLRQLREALALDPERSWDVTDTNSVDLGQNAEETRRQLSKQADVQVALTAPAYFADNSAELDLVLGSATPVVAFALSGFPDGATQFGPWHVRAIHRRSSPWDELSRTDQRRRYVNELVDAMHQALRPPQVDRPRDLPEYDNNLVRWSQSTASRRWAEDSKCAVEPELAETTLQESSPGQLDRPISKPLPAIQRLIDWACGDQTQWLCALLGDVGMGKTTTVKLFTQRLLELRAKGNRAPLPILFDLRDIRIGDLATGMTIDNILTTMLNAGRPVDVSADQLTAAIVRQRVAQGDAVVVFDGLDEVLIHLSPHDRQLFTRQLWRAVEERSGSKILLTCRTQYFRTIREETTFFLGEDRQGLRGQNYLALLMLPFGDEQIRDYLIANVGRDEAWVEGFLSTLAAVHNLPELARRPLTLRLIADQVEFIETAKAQGRTLRSVDLYREFVDRWLSRDSGKHTLQPDHKQLLMEHLAVELWRSGQNSWDPAQVEEWLLDLLGQRPDLQRHYRQPLPDLWKADFRTATFLSRDANTDAFSFCHRSMFEYFLAGYLASSLTDAPADQALDSWALPVPSPETLDFLGQLLAGMPDKRRSTALAALQRTTVRYQPGTSELALAYAIRAAEHGYPHHSLVGVHLAGARLTDWTIGSPPHRAGSLRPPPLSLVGANLTGADLRRARFHHVDLIDADLTDANLTNTEVHNSRLTAARFTNTRMTGTILRRCQLDEADLASANAYRAQLLYCTPQPQLDIHQGWLVAPQPTPPQFLKPERLQPLTGHRGEVSAVAYSPDGACIVSGEGERYGGVGGVRVWDAASGELLHTLAGHGGEVSAVAYSPGGSQIVAGGVGGVRVWDAASGELLHTLAGHGGGVSAVAYSPDGTHFVSTGSFSGGGGVVRVWDAASGELLHTLTGHHGVVSAVAYSPDGKHIVTGDSDLFSASDGEVRVWDAASGELLHTLAGHGGGVSAAAYSPDGTHFVTGEGDFFGGADSGVVRVWDAASGELLHTLTGHHGVAGAVAYSPDGKHIVTGDGDIFGTGDGVVRVWDAATGELLQALVSHRSVVYAVAYSPDGTHILTCEGEHFGEAGGGGVRVWDAASGELLHTLTGHRGVVYAAAYSPDGTRILTRDGGGVRVWEAATGELLHTLLGDHRAEVNAMAYSPDGARILTGGNDGVVRVWDAATTQPAGFTVRTLPDDELAVFDAVSHRLIGASDDAWRWLGWTIIRDGRITRIPAETFGPLPKLHRRAQSDTLGRPVRIGVVR